MKTNVLIAIASVLFCISCSSVEKGGDKSETAHTADVNVESSSQNSFSQDFPLIESRVKEFYENVVFGTSGDSAYLSQFCTHDFISKLERANDYDCEGYATWLLRSGMQDGPEDDSNVLSVSSGDNNTVVVEYNDLGHISSTTLEMIKVDGTWMINGATVPDGYAPL